MSLTNHDLISQTLQVFTEIGVETVIVCAGARNAPLVLQLEASVTFNCIPFFEERTASFFALGLTKATGKPVAVVTTSGTAVAELLSAAIEATYQGLPVLFVTADRPKNYRGTGAPQSIQQVGLLSCYAEQVLDWDKNTEDFTVTWSQKKPLHLNVCFDEPLLDEKSFKFISQKNILKFPKAEPPQDKSFVMNNPLIILGQINNDKIDKVMSWLKTNSAIIYAESLSQLRQNKSFSERFIISGEEIIKELFRTKQFRSVIRIGGVPTLRFWRDLEFEFKDIPVINVTDLNFSGLSRVSENISLNQIEKIQIKNAVDQKILQIDKENQSQKEKLLTQFEKSEAHFVMELSKLIGQCSLYLGNSLPIREWDQFSIGQENQQIYANRGANGIDGQISTYLGWSQQHAESWCLVGDLTAMYDLAALGLTPQLKNNFRRIVIMNNKGGHIFKKLFKSKLFLNAHQTEFEHWAKMWAWDYIKVSSPEELSNIKNITSKNLIVELQPDANQSDMFWQRWGAVCKKA